MFYQIDKIVLVMYFVECMFDLVNDVVCYLEFLLWCISMEIYEQNVEQIIVFMEIVKGGVCYILIICNQLQMLEVIEMSLVDGLFCNLSGCWYFKLLDDNVCKVILLLQFEFSGFLLCMVFGLVFSQVVMMMVDVFCK